MKTCGILAVLALHLLIGAGQVHAQSSQTGYTASDLYNLGNAYMRQGKPGMAVLNYERANLLSPNDPDIDANLSYVRASSHLPAPPRSTFERLARIAGPLALFWLGVFGLALGGARASAGQPGVP